MGHANRVSTLWEGMTRASHVEELARFYISDAGGIAGVVEYYRQRTLNN